jgi:beta-glucosidase/6-phospho-beta-glucosidase/beta-galactosidase
MLRHVTGTYDFFGLNYYTSRTAKAPRPTSDLKNITDINVIFGEFPNYTESAAPYYEVSFGYDSSVLIP